MPHARLLPAATGILLLASALASAAGPATLPPLVPAASPADLLLAQAAPAALDAGEGRGDSAALPVPRATDAGAPRRHRAANASADELEEKREHFRRMQSTGFGLMMGGIGAGAGGLILMISAIASSEKHTDAYGNTTYDDPPASFFIGYLSLVAVCPSLLTPGIILNRIGNHKRAQYDRMIEESGGAHLDIGPNSLRLTYSF